MAAGEAGTLWTDKRGGWAVSIDGARSQSMSELSDDELLAAVRAGDRDAYGSLYERHAPSARRYARALLANRPDADDAVGEVFARLLQVIERGRGPDHTFAAYLFASVRHECVRIERRRTREALDRAAPHPADQRSATADHAAGVAEAAVLRAAFASLPGEMRDILRLTEVDQLPQREIATRLAADPGTVATRAMRARRALGSAYLLQHVGIGGHRLPPGTGCQDTRSHIASFVRGTTGSRRRARIEEHLATCAACRAECADLRRINGHLRSIAFAVLAAVRTAGEAAWSHLAAVAASSAAPLAAAGVVTATALAPVMVAPPPSTVPRRTGCGRGSADAACAAPSDGAGDGARPPAGRRGHGGRRSGLGDGHRRGRHRPIDWGDERARRSQGGRGRDGAATRDDRGDAIGGGRGRPTDLRVRSRRQSAR